MKTEVFTVFLVVFSATMSPVTAEFFDQFVECVKTTALYPGGSHTLARRPGQRMMCVTNCILQGADFMTADGSFDAPSIKSKFSSENIGDMVDSCIAKAQTRENICIQGLYFIGCSLVSAPKVMLDYVRSRHNSSTS